MLILVPEGEFQGFIFLGDIGMLAKVFSKVDLFAVALKAQMQMIDTLGIAMDGVPLVE